MTLAAAVSKSLVACCLVRKMHRVITLAGGCNTQCMHVSLEFPIGQIQNQNCYARSR